MPERPAAPAGRTRGAAAEPPIAPAGGVGATLLVDYLSLLYRAFFSLPSSLPMHGVHGFLSMLARLVADRRPRRLAVAVDEDWRPAFRVDALPTYKSHRVSDEPDPVGPQDEVGRAVLEALGIAVVGAPEYEAEDVIATLAAGAREDVEIVSGDRDLFALVRDAEAKGRPAVRVLYPVQGVRTLAVVDEAEVQRRYGIPGRAYGDFALLRGDPSDGLPGVPGIGEKTASRLVAAYGSLDGVLAATDLPPAIARKLAGAADYLAAARRVVPPVADVPIGKPSLALPTRAADPRRLAALVDEHQLAGPVERLQTALAEATA